MFPIKNKVSCYYNRNTPTPTRFPRKSHQPNLWVPSHQEYKFHNFRSLIQNAMDATRFLSVLTQNFSQLIVPLGEVPPRNLNIIPNHSRMQIAFPNMFGPIGSFTPDNGSGNGSFGQVLLGPILSPNLDGQNPTTPQSAGDAVTETLTGSEATTGGITTATQPAHATRVSV